MAGERVITDAGSVTSYWRDHHKGRDSTGSSGAGYNPAPTIQAISLTPTVYQQNTASSGSATQIAALSTATVNQTPGAASGATGTTQGGQIITPIIQVVAATGSTSGPTTVVRSGGINTSVPNNSLFGITPNPTAHHLIETDPVFANYRTWLSSDYLLNTLSLDPALTQKRLGDGFYEQKLIREQVAQLTGRRFLDGHTDDEAQYAALMNSGATFAGSHNLVPGVSLSAAQMAQLTSDIVWLVEKDITLLPSAGSGQAGQIVKALVPQLYVRVREGDLQSGGALIAGNNINLNLTGDITNSGTLAGRQVLALTAENIKNLGGRITGNDIGIQARTDLGNIGGKIEAMQTLIATAGRDLNVISTTRTQTNAQGSRTQIERLAGLYVTGNTGTLLASAGRDANLIAAAIQNQGSGDTTITANNTLNLGTLTENTSNRIVWDSNNKRSDSSKVDIGTSIQTQGNLTLQAGNDLNAKAANITSSQGNLTATAANNINLTAGEANVQVDEAHQHKSKGFLSKKTITTRDTLDQTTAQATTLSGQTTTVLANRDINLKGSNIVSDNGTTLAAQNNLTLAAATNTTTETHLRDEKKSGLFSGGGIGITIGTQQQSTDQKGTTTTAAASTVGSTQGNINLQAGKNYAQTGSDILAPQGNIDLTAQKIDIVEARETGNNQTETRFRQSGLTLALTSPVITAVQTAQQMGKAANDTRDPRMKALAAGTAALAAKNGYDAVQADPKAAGGISLSITVGNSKSQSNSVQTRSTAQGSNVAAGGDVNLTATGLPSPAGGRGAGGEGDITVQGSTVQAGNDITLKADDEIKLLAAKNTAEQHSTNKNSSASIGVSIGTNTGVTLGGSKGRGNADGSDVAWSNTHIEAGNQLTLQSGGDTTMKGAVASGKQVTANVGGPSTGSGQAKLTVESLQDTSTYKSRQQSLGGSLTVGAGVSGSFSASRSKIDSNYASVTEQSGIRAGNGGFNVNVAGNTDLKGGAITSTQQAIDDNKNNFITGVELTTSDIQNQASYKASGVGVNIGTGTSPDGKLAPQGTGAGIGKDSGNASSITQAAISGVAGNKDARTGGAETGIAKIFDADKVQKEINAQTQITQMFGQQASKAIGDYAAVKTGEAAALRDRANKEIDPERIRELKAQAQTLEDQWGEHGTLRLAAHTLVGGLTGGASGAAGSAAGTLTAPEVAKALNDAGVDPNLAKTLTAIASTTVGGIVGGTAGAGAALNEVANNYLTHTQQAAREQALKDCKTLACKAAVNLQYAGISAMQDAGLAIGVGGGMGYQAYEQGAAVVEMVKNLPETLTALNAIVNDPVFRASVGNQIADDYKQRIDMQTRAYNEGGWDGSITAGVEAGRLAVDVVSAALVVKSAAQLSGTLAKAGVNASANALESAALQFMKLDAGAIKGFKSADELNAAMLEANKYLPETQTWSPAWKPGTTVAETTIKPGTRVQMVVDEKAFNVLTDLTGKADISRSFGGWATFDNVPNQAYARNQLAMTPEFKQNVGYVIEVEITQPISAQVGVVGAQNFAVGGGNQLHFILNATDRSSVFKVVGGRALP